MKKIVFVLGLVMALSLVSVASATTLAELQAQLAALQAQIAAAGGSSASVSSVPVITKSLTIGSKGDEVSALQMYLEDGGYLVMPAGVDYGYFGALTKTAVSKWQAANAVTPSSGYFGPISRAALDALRATAPATGTGLPAGCTSTAGFSPTTGASCGTAVAPSGSATFTLDGTDGSVSASQSSIAPTAQTMKKGDTKDVYGIRLVAAGGNVSINRLDVYFTKRPWLIFDKLVLKDASGNVLATKTLSGASDVTVVTEGSNYYARFDGVNVTVVPGTDTNLVVGATVPANNSYVGTAPYDTVTVSVPAGAIRTLNGKGIYDSTSVTGTDVITLTSTGSTADLTAVLAPTSPATGPLAVNAAGGADKTNAPLAVYRFRSSNRPSTLNTLVFNINNIDASLVPLADLSTMMRSFKLSDGSTSYYGTLSGTTVTFTITNGLKLPQDTFKDLTLSADISATGTNWKASTTLDVSGTSAVDDNYNSPTWAGGTIAAGTDVVSNTLTITSTALSVSNPIVNTPVAISNGQAASVNYDWTFRITLDNSSVSNLYVSAVKGDMFSTTSLANGSSATDATTTIVSVLPTDTLNGDSAGVSYVIPAGGSRVFDVASHIGKNANTNTSRTLTVASVRYGTASGTYGSSVTAGLNTLTRLVSFSGTD